MDNLLKASLVLYPSVPGPPLRRGPWSLVDGVPVSDEPITPGYHFDTLKDLLFWIVFGLGVAGVVWLMWYLWTDRWLEMF